MMTEIRRGDVLDIDFEPAVVVQNNMGNRYSPLVIVSPIRGIELDAYGLGSLP